MTNVDPDAFASGTDISNAFSGVTLSTVDQAGTSFSVLSLASAVNSTAPNVFGRNNAGPNETTWGNGVWELMRVDFGSPATSVSLDFVSDDSSDSNAVLAAYDSAGNLLVSSASVGSFSTGQVATLNVSASGIATVLALGDPSGSIATIANAVANGGGNDAWVLDNLTYVAVPEPATVGLGLLGLAALGLRRRRRTA